MPLRFREDRTTQAAARLLRLRGAKMPYLSLIKLLYLADRKALLDLGRPISYDLFVSMPHGPVLSRTLDLITTEPDPDRPSYWREYISEPKDYEVSLLKDPPNDQLSPAIEEILDEVFRRYGHLDKWALRDYTHTLPEWEDPEGSSVLIPVKEILIQQGVSPEDAEAICRDLGAEAFAEHILS